VSDRQRSRYRLISGDSHVNEPGDLWTARIPSRYAERAPRIESFEQGDAWVLDGVADPINFGMNACAGLPPEQMTGWKRFDEIRSGGYDPAARLEEMDQDGVDAEVLYPTPRLSQAVFAYTDPDFHLALVRAYNDWLAEYVAYAPDRFAGLALLPNRGAEGAVAEAKRVQDLPGIRGVVMGCYPNGTLSVEPEDDALFGHLAEAGIPLSIHVSLTQALPSAHRSPLPGYGRFFDAPNRIVEMIFAGIFDRFPALSVVIAEVDCGWVPYFKEQIDNNYQRLDAVSDFIIDDLPSAYVERNVHFTFITDTFGVRNRHDVGVDNMLWSSDYPHISADWPYSWRSIQAAMSGVPHEEREQLLAGNAVRLYRFG
jgi:predicted TIM-barrel fold metal-dependent hydrolase